MESRSAILEPLSRGEPVRGAETLLRTKSGEVRTGRLWSEQVSLSAEPTILTIIEDVTDLRQAQARLLESERVASIGRTASFVAHELNTPLTNIALLTASLRRLTEDPAVRERLDRMDAQRRLAARIIEDVMTFTRATSIHRAETDVAMLLRAAAEQAAAYRREGVALDLAVSEEPVLANVDPLKMSQAFVNLVKNAYQATEAGRVAVALVTDGRDLRVEVADTGKGMTPEERARLFEPFFSTKSYGEGIGLGLTLVKAVVDAHGGTIDVATEPGKGSTFTLRIPAGGPTR